MTRLDRRNFLRYATVASAGGLCASWNVVGHADPAESPLGPAQVGTEYTAALFSWPSRAIQLPTDPADPKPPVVTALRAHRDGVLLASAGDDHVVRVWDLNDGRLRQRLTTHTDWVRTVDYSPDGKLLATAGNDQRILLWDAIEGKLSSELGKRAEAVANIRFSPDGTQLAAVGFEGTAVVYDVATGKELHTLETPCQDMRQVMFSPDGTWLASGGRCGTIRIHSLENEQILRDIPAHKLRIRAISFSPDGKYLASTGEDRSVHVVPLEDMGVGYRLPARPVKLLALTFYGSAQLAVAGSDNLIRLWDVAQRQEIGLLSGHTGSVAALDCLGKSLISAGYDTTVRVWTISDNIAGEGSVDGKRVGSLPGKKLE